jgi:small subunit ribosomal protein S16
VAVKIKLKRLGKIRQPHYRIVVADSRTKRDGRAIEEIGLYDPMPNPSLITLDSERVQYWLSVGAQPTESVVALLKVTGDWQKFKGLPGAEGSLEVAEAKPTKAAVFEAAAKEAAAEQPAKKALKAETVAAEEADLAAAATQQDAEAAGVAAMADAEAVVEEAATEVVAEAEAADTAAAAAQQDAETAAVEAAEPTEG